jgi:membrane protein YqaA with SNARE-associated domain
MSELFLLFFSSLIAATVIPTGSELILVGLIKLSDHNMIKLVLIATAGNVLGAIINWFLGTKILYFQNKKYFPLKPKQLAKATAYFEKYGKWSLLFAWVPIIGDPLTVISGVLKTNFLTFLILVSIGKFLRYATVVMFFI